MRYGYCYISLVTYIQLRTISYSYSFFHVFRHPSLTPPPYSKVKSWKKKLARSIAFSLFFSIPLFQDLSFYMYICVCVATLSAPATCRRCPLLNRWGICSVARHANVAGVLTKTTRPALGPATEQRRRRPDTLQNQNDGN